MIGSIANIVAECKDYFSRSSLSRFCVNCVSPKSADKIRGLRSQHSPAQQTPTLAGKPPVQMMLQKVRKEYGKRIAQQLESWRKSFRPLPSGQAIMPPAVALEKPLANKAQTNRACRRRVAPPPPNGPPHLCRSRPIFPFQIANDGLFVCRWFSEKHTFRGLLLVYS